MRWLLALMLCGCETAEMRAWSARRAELERRQEELTRLEAQEARVSADELRRALDLASFVRGQGLNARVFLNPPRVTVTGTVQQCRDTLAGLAELRWLTETWRLRLDGDRCEWEARTGADYAAIEKALVAPPVRWAPPSSQVFSRGLAEVRAAVAALEAQVAERERRLGLEGQLGAVKPLIDSLRARAAPCDLAVLDRELALDRRGQLLEVESNKLVHPLEPRGDFRLRGFVEVIDGSLVWRCADEARVRSP